jgi:hypothetical protein
MRRIASHKELNILAPETARFSFFKSPYPSHRNRSAVDIYYGNFGDTAFSPVSGKIIDIRKYATPTPYTDKSYPEYLIAIKHDHNHTVKILHVHPEVNIGDEVKAGDEIGHFIWNGYFDNWNDACMHVEVRDTEDYLRATNHHPLRANIPTLPIPAEETLSLKCRVERECKNYTLLSSPHHHTARWIKGYAVKEGFIDGFIPLEGEGFFGLVGANRLTPCLKASVRITDDNEEPLTCRGIAFLLHHQKPFIKLVHQHPQNTPHTSTVKIELKIECTHNNPEAESIRKSGCDYAAHNCNQKIPATGLPAGTGD